ncbi:cobalamin biosynthesis protein [Oceanisphaera avium]|uniref:Cobalamin biosynthesis protein CbiB n=1 Tax=Oceanisphaera avium TaxID=1903694 RepID=A0A1Y0CZJ7_9GAMM|nr:cobalamin biosynthesis protein [Oceanisphaera avium]ART80235.1 cobalamin biosynthesis protein CbiB [Oceanisphaera avium]
MLHLALLEQPVALLTLAILLSLALPATRLQALLVEGLQRLGRRLNGTRYQPRYLKFAGSAAMLCLLLPLLATYWALAVLAPWPHLLEPLLLWCCLDLGRLSRIVPSVLGYSQSNKPLARLSLAPICLRNTDPLSPLGLYKALAEVSLLRLATDFALLVCYLAGGIYLALFFGLLRYLVQAWPYKLVQWRAFGMLPSYAYRLLAWLPFQLLTLSLFLYPGSLRAMKAWPQGKLWGYSASGRLLAVAAGGVNVGLGGPRRYTEATDYYPKLGTAQYINEVATRALLWRVVIIFIFWLSLAWAYLLIPLVQDSQLWP